MNSQGNDSVQVPAGGDFENSWHFVRLNFALDKGEQLRVLHRKGIYEFKN